MNVALLCEFGSINGGENSILSVLPLLKDRGVAFRVLAPPETPFADAVQSLGIELVPFSVSKLYSLPERREQLAAILRHLRPNLLHANSLSMGRLSGPVAEELKLPSISHLRDIINLNGTVVADLNRHGKLLAVSEAVKRFHVAQGLDTDRCSVLYNGVDLMRFAPRSPTGYLHREFGIPAEAPLLAVIGQIGLRKGQDFLLGSLRPLFADRKEPHLLVVGRRWSEKDESVQFEMSLRKIAEETPYKNRVHFLGVRRDVPELLAELTLLVHPARQEPLGRVLLEAAACGVCVVASDVGGTSEIFADGDSAKLFPVDDADVLRNIVSNLLDSEFERIRLGVAARYRAETMFAVGRTASLLFKHYEAFSSSSAR